MSAPGSVQTFELLMSDIDLSQLPRYMTTCYPFIHHDDVMQHSSVAQEPWNNVLWQPMVAEQRDLTRLESLSASMRLDPETTVSLPVNRLLKKSIETGGCQPHWNDSSVRHVVVNAARHRVCKFCHHHGDLAARRAVQVTPPSGRRHPVCMSKVSVGVQYESDQRRNKQFCSSGKLPTKRTVICKDCETQTDFSYELSDKSLVERPSSLYLSSDERHWMCTESVPQTTVYYEYPVDSTPMVLVPDKPLDGGIDRRHLNMFSVNACTEVDTLRIYGDDVIKPQVSALTCKLSTLMPAVRKMTGKPAKDVKTAKKKQKREAQLSRAADVELAEISLEQHVLQQLSQRRLPVANSALGSGWIDDCDTSPRGATYATLDSDVPGGKNQSSLKKVVMKDGEGDSLSSSCDTPISAVSDASHQNIQCSSNFLQLDCTTGSSSKTSSHEYQFCGVNTSSSSIADLSPVSQNSPLTFSTPSASPLSSGFLSPSSANYELKRPTALNRIHSRRFREYCNQVLSREIDDCCTQLLQHLVKSQTDAIQCGNPSVKRRIVLGLREVTKFLRQALLKAVIISPNMEKIQSKGGLDETLHSIIHMCQERQVPLIFALGRRALGRACAKPVPVSVVGIFSYEGLETQFERLCQLTKQARQTYQELVAAVSRDIEHFALNHGRIVHQMALVRVSEEESSTVTQHT